MGLREVAAKAKANAEKYKFNTSYEGYSLMADKLRKGGKSWPIAGAHAQCDSGASAKRMTLTRVGTGALVLGPLGAILGGMAKKDRTRVYVLVELSTGEGISFDVPAKDEAKAREFVMKVNGASAMFSAAP